MPNVKKDPLAKPFEDLLKIVRDRFEKNKIRHQGLEWSKIQTKLEMNPQKLQSLHRME